MAEYKGIKNVLKEFRTRLDDDNEVRVVTLYGHILNDNGKGLKGHGVCSVRLHKGKAEIHFTAKVTSTATDNSFTWGINRDLLSERGLNINITPISGGTVDYYNPDGTRNQTLEGYGGTMEKSGQFWHPARVYSINEGQGVVGGWGSNQFLEGARIEGTCYGTY